MLIYIIKSILSISQKVLSYELKPVSAFVHVVAQ